MDIVSGRRADGEIVDTPQSCGRGLSLERELITLLEHRLEHDEPMLAEMRAAGGT